MSSDHVTIKGASTDQDFRTKSRFKSEDCQEQDLKTLAQVHRSRRHAPRPTSRLQWRDSNRVPGVHPLLSASALERNGPQTLGHAHVCSTRVEFYEAGIFHGFKVPVDSEPHVSYGEIEHELGQNATRGKGKRSKATHPRPADTTLSAMKKHRQPSTSKKKSSDRLQHVGSRPARSKHRIVACK